MPDIVSIFAFAGISLIAATLALLITGRWFGGGVSGRPAAGHGPFVADAARVYEFREGYLLSPLDPVDAFLADDTDRAKALDMLRSALTPICPGFGTALAALQARGEAFLLEGRIGPDPLTVAGRMQAERMILTIGPTHADCGRQLVDGAALTALQSEARDLRAALDHGETVAWTQARDGGILWANAAYFALLDRVTGDTDQPAWPLRQVFGDALDPRPDPGVLRRVQIPGGDLDASSDAPQWFEVSAIAQADDSILWSATPIDRLVKAESALRSFVQTLSQTFAHLPIGLAVFDKRRNLILFNPALVTLSTLTPEFLSSRPGLTAFLDALRDCQRMPEPKNYRSWRAEIAKLEQGAEDGSYQELWTLPGGQSFRVIGRPHPDGAVAFLFEDISSAIGLTRKFRGDLDLHQSLLDDTPGALVVFSGDGRMVLANAGYEALWGDDALCSAAGGSVIEISRLWQARCIPTGLWGDIRQFAHHDSERTTWAEDVEMLDGRRLMCRISPLAGGATAVRFLSVELVEAEGLVASFRRPRRPPRKVYEAAEAPAPFQSRRVADD